MHVKWQGLSMAIVDGGRLTVDGIVEKDKTNHKQKYG